MPRELGAAEMEMAVAGGAMRALGTAAIRAGKPMLFHPDKLPDDAIIATAAAIGAPGDQTAWEMHGVDQIRAAALLAPSFLAANRSTSHRGMELAPHIQARSA
jgi:hypothetical protein